MAREPKCRRVAFEPVVTSFHPQGVPASEIDHVILKIEELEAIRLKDYLALDQEEGATTMNVSRPTFQRILTEAHAKVAEALINGKGIRIEGGNYCFGGGFCRRNGRHLNNEDDCPFYEATSLVKKANSMQSQNIAICTSGSTPDSMVADNFGRSSHFIIYNPSLKAFSILVHKGREAGHGAGANAAGRLLTADVGVIITKQIGSRSFAALQHLGIEIYTVSEECTAKETLDKYFDKQLQKLTASNSNQ